MEVHPQERAFVEKEPSQSNRVTNPNLTLWLVVVWYGEFGYGFTSYSGVDSLRSHCKLATRRKYIIRGTTLGLL